MGQTGLTPIPAATPSRQPPSGPPPPLDDATLMESLAASPAAATPQGEFQWMQGNEQSPASVPTARKGPPDFGVHPPSGVLSPSGMTPSAIHTLSYSYPAGPANNKPLLSPDRASHHSQQPEGTTPSASPFDLPSLLPSPWSTGVRGGGDVPPLPL